MRMDDSIAFLFLILGVRREKESDFAYMYHAQDTVPIGLYLYLGADNFNSYFPASRLGHLSHIKYCKLFNLNYSILTYSATICDSGSIASCFAN